MGSAHASPPLHSLSSVKAHLRSLRDLPPYRIASAALALGLIAASFALGTTSILVLLVAPVFFGCALIAVSWDRLTTNVDGWKTTFDDRWQRAAARDGKFARYFSRPLWAGGRKIWSKTERIPHRDLRAGLRLAIVTYYFGFMVAILALVAYVAIAIVIAVAFLLFILWALGKYYGWDNGQDRPAPVYQEHPATSRRVDGLTGNRIEHYDKQGRKIGESREREGILGKYVEHYNQRGKKTGESRAREGLIQDYVEHTDQEGGKTGETLNREGLLGPYSEHTDLQGRKTGESRLRDGILGEYVEHQYTPNASTAQICGECGARLEAGAKICVGCGRHFST